jgi:hypothetical protein
LGGKGGREIRRRRRVKMVLVERGGGMRGERRGGRRGRVGVKELLEFD